MREKSRSDELASRPKSGPEKDARGQSEKNHKGGSNDGVSSANPRVLSGNESGDATFPFKRAKPTRK